MGAARAVLKAETFYLVTQFGERSGSRGAGQPAPDYDHIVLPFVGWVHKLHLELTLVPFIGQGTAWNSAVQLHQRAPPFAATEFRVTAGAVMYALP